MSDAAAEGDDDLLPVLAPRPSLRVQPDEVIPHYEDTGWSRNGEHGGSRRYRFDDLRKAAYVRLIRHGVRRVRAAEMVGVSYGTVQEHFLRFPEFYDDVVEAEMARIDEVEEALFQTAIDGNVIAQQVVLYNRRPEEWSDRRGGNKKLEEGDEVDEEAAKAIDSLRDKLNGLRDRFGLGGSTVEDVPQAEEAEVVEA